MNQFCVLLAAPRSGTTVLGEAVAEAFQATWLQEIFHESYADLSTELEHMLDVFKRGSFFNFKFKILRSKPELSYPSIKNQEEIFHSYLESLSTLFSGSKILMDIKYTSCHHLNTYWSYMLRSEPYLVQILKKEKIPVVHLKRNNIFKQYCSQLLAIKTGTWNSKRPVNLSKHRLTIDVRDCEARMRKVKETAAMFSDWFRDHPVYELSYESLFGESGFSKEVEGTFTSIWGHSPQQPILPAYVKVTPRLSELIKNADEVLMHFSDTEYSAMVQEALYPGFAG